MSEAKNANEVLDHRPRHHSQGCRDERADPGPGYLTPLPLGRPPALRRVERLTRFGNGRV